MKSNEFITEAFEQELNNIIEKRHLDDNIENAEKIVKIGIDLYKPTGSNKEYKQWANLITKHCQPFLQESKGEELYRGLGTAKDSFMTKKVRLGDRKPKDMPLTIHKKLNTYFNMKFGAKFRNAMFVSGNENTANEYGSIYRVFPIGKYEYLWSPKVNDLYSYWEQYEPDNWNTTPEESKENLKRSLKEFYVNVLENNYSISNLDMAIRSENEIMLRCSYYYAIREDIADNVTDLLL